MKNISLLSLLCLTSFILFPSDNEKRDRKGSILQKIRRFTISNKEGSLSRSSSKIEKLDPKSHIKQKIENDLEEIAKQETEKQEIDKEISELIATKELAFSMLSQIKYTLKEVQASSARRQSYLTIYKPDIQLNDEQKAILQEIGKIFSAKYPKINQYADKDQLSTREYTALVNFCIAQEQPNLAANLSTSIFNVLKIATPSYDNIKLSNLVATKKEEFIQICEKYKKDLAPDNANKFEGDVVSKLNNLMAQSHDINDNLLLRANSTTQRTAQQLKASQEGIETGCKFRKSASTDSHEKTNQAT